MKQKILAGLFVFILLFGLAAISFFVFVTDLKNASTASAYRYFLIFIYLYWSWGAISYTIVRAIHWVVRDKK